MFDLSKCNKCGDCFVMCQYVDYDRKKAVNDITALIENREAEILKECTTCMACDDYCRKRANPFDLILRRQEEKGILPLTEEQLNELSNREKIPSTITKGDPGKPVLSLCVIKSRLPEGALQGQMFNGLTIVDGGDVFCHILYLHAARESYFKKNIQKFVNSFSKLNTNEVILLHDDCYTTATTKAREYGVDVSFKPVHIIEYLLNYLKAHSKSVTKLNKKIAYQRPCISRYTPEKEPLLDELFDLIGVQRVPRKYDRQNALCCGALFIGKYQEKGARFQDKNITDARSFGADAMVPLCPICWQRLKAGCQNQGLPLIYLTNLCRMALGELAFPQ